MSDGNWGHCEHCRYFGSPALVPLVNEEAPCEHPDLTRFHLVVFGASGCNAFELRAGAPAAAESPGYEATPLDMP